MKKLKNALLILSLVFISNHASAFTDCPNVTIGFIFNDGAHTYLGESGLSNLVGVIKNTNPQYEKLVSIAMAARVSGEKVTIRYQEDSVSCNAAIWSTTIRGIGF